MVPSSPPVFHHIDLAGIRIRPEGLHQVQARRGPGRRQLDTLWCGCSGQAAPSHCRREEGRRQHRQPVAGDRSRCLGIGSRCSRCPSRMREASGRGSRGNRRPRDAQEALGRGSSLGGRRPAHTTASTLPVRSPQAGCCPSRVVPAALAISWEKGSQEIGERSEKGESVERERESRERENR